jgi:hypothetical protein
MVFPNKGENHKIGIQNEKDIVNYMNKNPDNAFADYFEKTCNSKIKSPGWEHKGGTQQKMDASIQLDNGEIIGISIKNHKWGGTFDWANTSEGIDIELKQKISEFKDKNFDTPIPAKGGIRNELANIFSSYLDNNMSSEQITNFLHKIYNTEDATKHIIINHIKSRQLIMIHKSNLDKYFNKKQEHLFILKSSGRAKTSRQIWIKDTLGNEINTNLRIRVLLNNGITSLLGQSKSNKYSIPCMKLQQDKVDTFISNSINKVFVNY